MQLTRLLLVIALLTSSSAIFANDSRHYYLDIGTWFGGDKVAHNPDGDSYDAGSGAVFDFGLSIPLTESSKIYSRNTIGYRYQGAKRGEGGNKGIVIESSLVKIMGPIHIGAGIHGDLKSVTTDYFGNKTTFDDAFGPFLFFEFRLYDSTFLGVKYHLLDYTSTDGDEYSGKQFGLFITQGF